MSAKLTAYASALKQSEKEKDDNLAGPRAAEQKGKLGLKIATLDLEVQAMGNSIATISGKYPLDVDALTAALDEQALAERSLNQLKEISEQLFPA